MLNNPSLCETPVKKNILILFLRRQTSNEKIIIKFILKNKHLFTQ